MTASPRKGWRSWVDGVLGLVYPRNCVSCEAVLDGEGPAWLCESCGAKLHRIQPPYCELCGQTYDGEMTSGFQCANCAGLDLDFDFAIGAYRNEGLARELVHRFKYRREHHLCAPLGRLLFRALEDERLAHSLAGAKQEWTLVPVPLHPRRKRERQFNQSAELARVLYRVAREKGEEAILAPVNALRRTRHTRRQASLDRAERLTNLKGAFGMSRSSRLARRIEDAAVLLVDDVFTTGTTGSECARVLREEGGAAKIVVITVVRG